MTVMRIRALDGAGGHHPGSAVVCAGTLAVDEIPRNDPHTFYGLDGPGSLASLTPDLRVHLAGMLGKGRRCPPQFYRPDEPGAWTVEAYTPTPSLRWAWVLLPMLVGPCEVRTLPGSDLHGFGDRLYIEGTLRYAGMSMDTVIPGARGVPQALLLSGFTDEGCHLLDVPEPEADPSQGQQRRGGG